MRTSFKVALVGAATALLGTVGLVAAQSAQAEAPGTFSDAWANLMSGHCLRAEYPRNGTARPAATSMPVCNGEDKRQSFFMRDIGNDRRAVQFWSASGPDYCLGAATTDLRDPNGVDVRMVDCADPTTYWDVDHVGDAPFTNVIKNRYASEEYGQTVVLDLDTNNWARPQLWEYNGGDNQVWDRNWALWGTGNCYEYCV